MGPLITNMQASLGVSSAVASLLTTIPVFAFGAFAFLTPRLTRALGLHRLLGITMLVLAFGIAIRLHPSLTALMLGTVCVGAAIAVGNVAMPPAIKQDFADRTSLMMGLYSTALFLGAAIASGFAAPLLPHVGNDWRMALGVWALPALLAAAVWAPQFRRVTPTRKKHSAPGVRAIWRDPIALAVTALMGLQSMSYYIALTWIPTLLQDAGMTASQGGWMLSYSALPGILGSLITPALANRAPKPWHPIVVATLLTLAAYAGLMWSPTTGTLWWMTLLGLGQGAFISLSLTYIVLRAPSTYLTGQLSTMAQGFGYLLAGFGPLGIGVLYARTGSWHLPMVALTSMLVLQCIAGLIASRPTHVQPRQPH